MDGVLRGKIMSKSKFLSAAESSFGFCGVVYAWDSACSSKNDEKRCILGVEVVPEVGGQIRGWWGGVTPPELPSANLDKDFNFRYVFRASSAISADYQCMMLPTRASS